MKTIRKLSGTMFSMVLAVLMSVSVINCNAASEKSDALQAYKQVLSGDVISWGSSTASLNNSRFGLAYVNDDDIPELVVGASGTSHAEGYYTLYTYKNGKVTEIGGMMDGFSYYPRKNVVEAIHSGTGGYEHYYYKIVGIKVKNFLHKVSEKESGWDIDGNGKIKGTIYSKYISPTDWETKSISGKKFQSMLKKKVGSTKLKKMKYHKNTSDERERILQ